MEVKDIRLPPMLTRAMAAEAEAARDARAKVCAAEGEQKASRMLVEAANVISQAPVNKQIVPHITRQDSPQGVNIAPKISNYCCFTGLLLSHRLPCNFATCRRSTRSAPSTIVPSSFPSL